jgi:hypothetical protein
MGWAIPLYSYPVGFTRRIMGFFRFFLWHPDCSWCQPLIGFTCPIEFDQQKPVSCWRKTERSELPAVQTPRSGYLPLIEFLSPSACLTSGNRLTLGLPSPVCSAFRFSQPLNGLLLPDAYRLYFIPNPLMGFRPSEFFPSKDLERLSASQYRLNLCLNVNLLEEPTKSTRPGGKMDGDLHGFNPFGNPYTLKSG